VRVINDIGNLFEVRITDAEDLAHNRIKVPGMPEDSESLFEREMFVSQLKVKE